MGKLFFDLIPQFPLPSIFLEIGSLEAQVLQDMFFNAFFLLGKNLISSLFFWKLKKCKMTKVSFIKESPLRSWISLTKVTQEVWFPEEPKRYIVSKHQNFIKRDEKSFTYLKDKA